MGKSFNIGMKSIVLITVGIIALVVAFIFITENQIQVENGDITFDISPPIDNQPTMGEASAPVTIVEFGDYKCPACKSWNETVFPKIEEEYISSGKVKFSYINTLFHGEESALAAMASESVWNQDNDAFWDFHKEIFIHQPEAQRHDDVWVTPEKLIDIAVSVGNEIDLETLAEDMIKQTYKEDVLKDQELVEQYQVSLTPSIVINGTMVEDPFDYEHIVSLIEKELESN